MIHHVSIPARDPEHVAKVLGELLGGYVGPFVGPIPGAWVAYADDGNGSGFEIYPERTTFVPGKDDEMGEIRLCDAPASVAFHALVSVKVDRATIEQIGAREGWRTRHFWRGPFSGNTPVRAVRILDRKSRYAGARHRRHAPELPQDRQRSRTTRITDQKAVEGRTPEFPDSNSGIQVCAPSLKAQ